MSCYRRGVVNHSSMLTVVIMIVLTTQTVMARPRSHIRDRRSGISDQRLAELETLMALARLRGQTKAVTRPVGHGLIDIAQIGRRRRRSYDDMVNTPNDILYLLSEELPQDDESMEEEGDQKTGTGLLTRVMSSLPPSTPLRLHHGKSIFHVTPPQSPLLGGFRSLRQR